MLWYLIVLIVVIGAIAIAYVAARAMGVAIPDWVIKILWIIGIVVVAVVAIRFLATLL